MQKTITVSAPGKLLLLGEHSVVYGYPCLVTSVNQRLYLTATLIPDDELQLEAPDVKINGYKKLYKDLGTGEIPKGARFIEHGLANFLRKYPFQGGVRIETKSDFSSQYGFGSSSASTVCLIKAISELNGIHLSKSELFEISYHTLLDVAGKGSGFDIAAAIYGGVLYYVTPGKVIEPIEVTDLSLVVGYTGIKVDTVQVVNEVAQLKTEKPELVHSQFETITTLVEKAKIALIQKNWSEFGRFMNVNQEALDRLGVSSAKLDAMVTAARGAGAFGAKLSGAGRGDCMIALVSSEKKNVVCEAVNAVGGQVIPIQTNVAGVNIEI